MKSLIVFVALFSLPIVSLADSMRCGQYVVNEETVAAELLQKCGEPQKKDVTTEDVISRSPAGFTRKIGTQVTERWYYQRSSASLPMVVTVVDGKIKRIERAD
jgi:Protein of unknown function (DUF2845)